MTPIVAAISFLILAKAICSKFKIRNWEKGVYHFGDVLVVGLTMFGLGLGLGLDLTRYDSDVYCEVKRHFEKFSNL